MSNYKRLEETRIFSHNGYTLSSTHVGYLVKGPGINIVTTTLRRACMELVEHIIRTGNEKDNEDILSILERVEEVYCDIEAKLNKTITKCYFPTADWNKELREMKTEWP